jgi:hypothetical protein
MKKIFLITFLLFLHSYICISQASRNKDSSKIEDVKIAYMTQELNLSPAEAERFWPIYDSYFQELRQAKKMYGDDEIAFDEKVVDIRKRYKGSFKRVLNSDTRVNRVFVSEKNLRDMLKKELQNRRIRRQGPLKQGGKPKN